MSPLGGIQIIPVPAGMSAEQAWEHVRTGTPWPLNVAGPATEGGIPPGGTLAMIEVDGEGNFLKLHEVETD